VISATALFGAAIAAWGYRIAPPPPPPPAPAAVAPATTPSAGPDAAAEPSEEAVEPTSAPSVVTSPVTPSGPSPTASAEIILPAAPGKKKNKKRDAQNGRGSDGDEGRFGSVELKGRIFVLGEVAHTNVTILDSQLRLVSGGRNAADITLASVRPALHWHAPQKWLSAMIEVEFTQKPDIRDAYIQLKQKDFMLRAGQFKMPGSAIELASPWALPFVRRGFLHGLLVDELDNAWRRPGLMLRWRGADLPLRPEINAGIFQGFVLVTDVGERDKDLIVNQGFGAQSLIGRAQIEPVDGVAIGAYYHHRVGTPALLQNAHYWTTGADLVVDRTFASGGLRIWLDGIAGASWFKYPTEPVNNQDTTFVTGRSILAWRFGGLEQDQRYLEVYGTFGVLDPDVDVVSDLAVEVAVGFNLGLWQRLRLTAQGEIWRAGRNFPPGYTLGADPDRAAVLLQLGVNL